MSVDRWGPKATQESKQVTPEQFEAAWQKIALKALKGEPVATEVGPYYTRCGRKITPAKFCMQRMGHSSSCSPNFGNACDAPLPNAKRCVLNAGHKGKCIPVFPR